MAKTRSEIDLKDAWDLEPLYKNWDSFYIDLETVKKEESFAPYKIIKESQGKLSSSFSVLKGCLDAYFSTARLLKKIYTFAHLKHDEELTEEKAKKGYSEALFLFQNFQTKTAWIVPEILSFPEDFIEKALKEKSLSLYHFYLEEVFRLKPHCLSSKEETLLAEASTALDATHKAFSALNDADLNFGTVLDSTNQEHELTHGTYSLFLINPDRVLRKNSFFALHKSYSSHENTLTELLGGTVHSHVFSAKARNYKTALSAALTPKNIETKVYTTLIEGVSKNLPTLHRYIALRKKLLQLEELHYYDLYVPLTGKLNKTIPYEEAELLILEALTPLGEEYLSILKEGLKEKRWVDRYENKAKRSGAYSSGCYDSEPYILMNYKGTIRDVFTLAHEIGHSMHSYFSAKNQPFLYSDYSIFVAEVASTFNEALLADFLLKKATTKEEKIFLINQQIEDIRATLFRQTLFAEFELFIHSMTEQQIPLTTSLLKEHYLTLNKKYYGEALTLDPEVSIEWSRIPHFYYDFYVYQYATGISAALTLSEKVLNKEEKALSNYLSFLKSGSSDYPLAVLKKAGVDMQTPEPVEKAIAYFGHLVDELETLMT